jgi:hypothetical protein
MMVNSRVRGYSIYATVLLVLVAAGHILGRSFRWQYEWDWAIWQYNFVVVLLCPLVAGVAAIFASDVARLSSTVRLSARHRLALLTAMVPVAIMSIAAFAAGLIAVLAYMAIRGVPGAPSIAFALSPTLAIFQIVLAVVFGCTMGLMIRRGYLSAPLAGVAFFALVLYLYVKGNESVVVVGGATASLFGLQLDGRRLAWQAGFYLLVLVFLSLLALGALHQWRVGRAQLALTIVAIASIIGMLGYQPHFSVFREVSEKTLCRQDDATPGVAICVAPGYEELANDAAARLLPYTVAVDELVGPRPTVYVQAGGAPGIDTDGRRVGILTVEFLRGSDEAAALAVSTILRRCDDETLERLRARTKVYAWVFSHAGTGNSVANGMPDYLANLSKEDALKALNVANAPC